MYIDMHRQDTGEFRARLTYFIKDFLNEHQDKIGQLYKGDRLTVHKEISLPNESQYYDLNFIFTKGGFFSESKLQVIANGTLVATVTL